LSRKPNRGNIYVARRTVTIPRSRLRDGLHEDQRLDDPLEGGDTGAMSRGIAIYGLTIGVILLLVFYVLATLGTSVSTILSKVGTPAP
jgi:hypothetical protein